MTVKELKDILAEFPDNMLVEFQDELGQCGELNILESGPGVFFAGLDHDMETRLVLAVDFDE